MEGKREMQKSALPENETESNGNYESEDVVERCGPMRREIKFSFHDTGSF